MNHTTHRLAASLLGALALGYLPFAQAVSTSYGFSAITNNNAGAVADGNANLLVEVIDVGSSQVQFKFTNNSSSTLTDVYFDNGPLLSMTSITSSGGVSFSEGAAPPILPGGSSISPSFDAAFSADSNPSVSHNGVTSGEWLAITFSLLSGETYASTLTALSLPGGGGGTGDLRIGVHVQSFAAGGGSESFINVPTPIPEPSHYAMMLAGLGLVGLMVRRQRHIV